MSTTPRTRHTFRKSSQLARKLKKQIAALEETLQETFGDDHKTIVMGAGREISQGTPDASLVNHIHSLTGFYR